MILSKRSGQIRTRELEEEALRNDWTIETNRGRRDGGEGARQPFPGWIIRRAQRKFENKLYEVNGAA